MITCDYNGGLGNQLFQIFNCISYSLDHNIDFFFIYKKVLVRSLNNHTERCTYWDNLLNNLHKLNNDIIINKDFIDDVNNTIDTNENIDSINANERNGVNDRNISFLTKIINLNHIKKKYLKESRYNYDKLINITTNYKTQDIIFVLSGYFQSPKYFCHNQKQIINILNLNMKKRNVYNKFLKIYNKLLLSNNYKINNDFFTNFISIHFRIGDYARLLHTYIILDVNYYINSLNYIFKKIRNSTYYNSTLYILYFCEDEDFNNIQSIIHKLNILFDNLIFIKINSSSHNHNEKINNISFEDWEQMLLMSLCQYNIIANSTFSWWGSYLNEHADIICFPEIWFNKNNVKKLNTKDLLDTSILGDKWIMIKNS